MAVTCFFVVIKIEYKKVQFSMKKILLPIFSLPFAIRQTTVTLATTTDHTGR